ncbi:MAG: hypothetical protein WC221_09280, partial [Candidatus Riflebacteria bacterium]
KFFERQDQKSKINENLSTVMSIFSTHPSETERSLRLANMFKSLEPKEYVPITPDYGQIKSLLNKLPK